MHHEAKGIFDFYVTSIGLQETAKEIISHLSIGSQLLIVLTFFIILFKSKNRWFINAKRSPCNSIPENSQEKLHSPSGNHCKRITGPPKNPFEEDTVSTLFEDNEKSNTTKDVTNYEVPRESCSGRISNGERKKDDHHFHPTNTFYMNMNSTLPNKLMQDDLIARYELLNVAKKLYLKMKKIHEKERALRDATENATLSSGNLQNPFPNRLSRMQRRKSFFTKPYDDSIKLNTTFWIKEEIEEKTDKNRKDKNENTAHIKLVALEEQVNQLKEMHLREIELLYDKIRTNETTVDKLEKLHSEMVQLFKQMQPENEHDFKSKNIHESNYNTEAYKEVTTEDRVSDIENDLLPTDVNQEDNDSDDKSVQKRQLSVLKEHLNHYKEASNHSSSSDKTVRAGSSESVSEEFKIESAVRGHQDIGKIHAEVDTFGINQASHDYPLPRLNSNRISRRNAGARIVKPIRAGQRPTKTSGQLLQLASAL